MKSIKKNTRTRLQKKKKKVEKSYYHQGRLHGVARRPDHRITVDHHEEEMTRSAHHRA